MDKRKEELIKAGVLLPDKVKRPVRKLDAYQKKKLSKMGVRRTLANWQQDNFLEFMDTWQDIEDPAMKARLYLDSLQFTLGKVGSVDLNVQNTTTTLEQRLTSIINGKETLNIEQEIEDAEIEEQEENE